MRTMFLIHCYCRIACAIAAYQPVTSRADPQGGIHGLHTHLIRRIRDLNERVLSSCPRQVPVNFRKAGGVRVELDAAEVLGRMHDIARVHIPAEQRQYKQLFETRTAQDGTEYRFFRPRPA